MPTGFCPAIFRILKAGAMAGAIRRKLLLSTY